MNFIIICDAFHNLDQLFYIIFVKISVIQVKVDGICTRMSWTRLVQISSLRPSSRWFPSSSPKPHFPWGWTPERFRKWTCSYWPLPSTIHRPLTQCPDHTTIDWKISDVLQINNILYYHSCVVYIDNTSVVYINDESVIDLRILF